ncbi:filamentation induced By CAMP protein Fic [Corallococcus coralloides]|uniref:Filamentation induced By CAMP protein Fic n=1 Tax=Corallococcus coralloides TaxID=184914 RepID=A0A410RYJ8_CORCK|nr:Fic family protein [Corallococcus coralloides]QAT87034.1 filamentation induced By CAMP protein Fic [Corallococcus coralloides]
MRLPAMPPDLHAFVQTVARSGAEQLVALLERKPVGPEPDGRYLHWDELRRHPAPEGMTHEEWWYRVKTARTTLSAELPLLDKTGQPFCFTRPDGLLSALHRMDRQLGKGLELAGPQLANSGVRERYIVESLMEEAITSSQLEGASTTRKVAREMLEQGRPPRTKDERMIFNNFQAMELMRRNAHVPLTTSLLLELHETITRDTLDAGEEGRLRRDDESITVQDRASGAILHVPPDASELPGRLRKLCAFANGSDASVFIHPVVRAIVIHFMLAYDHPFVDGNGRTARALFYWCMIREGYWIAEFLSISRIIQRAQMQYSRAFLFTETDRGDLTYFLLHQLDVIQRATDDLYAYLERKGHEARQVELLLKRDAGLNPRQRELLAHALHNPAARYDIQSHRRRHGVVYQTARQDLLDLEAAGFLERDQVGRAYFFSPVAHLERRLKKHKP